MRKYSIALFGGALALSLAACDVDQTEEAELPDVDVSADEGNLPEYDVEPADVDVDTGTTEVEVPTMDVDVSDPDAEGEPVTE